MDKGKALKNLIANAICTNSLFENCEECPFYNKENRSLNCNKNNEKDLMEAVKLLNN